MTTLFHNIAELLTLEGAVKKSGKHLCIDDLSVLKNAALITDENKILWIGKDSTIPISLQSSITQKVDCNKSLLTPALVDSHTHLVFAGKRSHEFNLRLSGASYEEIAAAGGGIAYSSDQTNSSSNEELLTLSRQRINQMYQLGLTALEIKTGYSLELEGELNLLKVINHLKNEFKDKIYIHRTLMSAHSINKNYTLDSYVEQVVLPSIEYAAKNSLVDSVDVFHEKNYFDKENVERIFSYANQFQLSFKIHADELNNNQGAALAGKWKCLSADHLLQSDLAGARALAQSGVIATILPGTAFFLGKPMPPAKMLADAGCALAIASDFNPGSCFYNDVFQIARMSAPSLKINSATLWAAITFNAARALNISHLGAIIPGFKSNLLQWNADSYEDLLYDWNERPHCKHL